MYCLTKYLTMVRIYWYIIILCIAYNGKKKSMPSDGRDRKTTVRGRETILTVMLLSWTTFVTVILLLTRNSNPFGLSSAQFGWCNPSTFQKHYTDSTTTIFIIYEIWSNMKCIMWWSYFSYESRNNVTLNKTIYWACSHLLFSL